MHDAALTEYRARIESLESAIKSRDAEVQRLHESNTALAQASNARKEQLEDERGKFEERIHNLQELAKRTTDVSASMLIVRLQYVYPAPIYNGI
jgi:hypothetical protein